MQSEESFVSNNILQYLETLVSFYPISKQQDNVLNLLRYVQKQLIVAGMQVTILEHNGVHSLYAHPAGKKHSRLLLQGHIDVVPGQDQPYKQIGKKLYGRGCYDMLFAAACYLQLINKSSEHLADLDLAIMLSGDEELGGFNGVQAFLEAGYTTDCCVLPDAGEGMGSLNIAAKGVYCIDIAVHGNAHHASRPWEGDNAAFKLTQCIAAMYDTIKNTPTSKSTITLSRLQAGEASNKGPAIATATLDIRFADRRELKRIQSMVSGVLAQYNGTITATDYAPNYELDLTNKDVKTFLQIYEENLGSDIRLTKAHGSSDARFFSEKGTPVIMLRPDGGGAHGDEEWISEPSINTFYNILEEFVTKTCYNKGTL